MAHTNRLCSRWLKWMPRHECESRAEQHPNRRTFRQASRGPHFVAMMMGPLSGRNSLRDRIDHLDAQAHRRHPLGRKKWSRSTLSRTNNDKSHRFYDALFNTQLVRCQSKVPSHRFRFKTPLSSLDARTLDRCLAIFPWADLRSTQAAIT